ncbi:MAG: FAD-dependent oxidoreductase, partial [Rhodospirillaceae bacterium]|nr:FAD-dependent oxidoreductase [Rhodospirillaceae bacterium]
MSLSVAIIGSGPAAFYTADALVKSDSDCRVDIIERLPCPYGLIRFGVAPDHEKTKNVMRAFAKTAAHEDVNFYGNVEIGKDIGLPELRDMYDAVVLAVGAGSDRAVGIPGEDKKGVFGSATFVNWYNGHPDFRDLNPDLDVKGVVVLGNGNVAIDVARVLVKTPGEMAATDLPDYAADPIQASPLSDVYMVGRRGPNEAKYTNVELREMGHLENCVPQIEAAQLPDSVDGEMSDRDRRLREKNLATVREFVDRTADEKPKRVHFVYYAQPVEILGGDNVEAVRFERTEVRDGRAVGLGEYFEISCGLVVAAIGYTSKPVADTPFDERGGIVTNDDGRVADGLYAVGWIKRGPSGVIGSNKPDGKLAAEQ